MSLKYLTVSSFNMNELPKLSCRYSKYYWYLLLTSEYCEGKGKVVSVLK